MHCPVCGTEVQDEPELMACLTNHFKEEATRQTKESQKVYLMMMASQLTMACYSAHATPKDVVGSFGEVYSLLENLIGKSDVSAEIEDWLSQHKPKSEE